MANAELKLSDQLAIDRTRLAAERSLMAWIRTALSMIGFGFTIYKFLQTIQQQSNAPVLRPNAPRNVGLLLVGMGTAAVVVAWIQHRQYIKRLSPDQPFRLWELASIMAILIALLGVLILGSMVYTSGPFG